MLKHLVLNNFPSGYEPELISDKTYGKKPFVLKTCQRTVVLSYAHNPIPLSKTCEVQNGTLAYKFLLETICGLKSKLIGENEIVGQFKTAYKEFVDHNEIQTDLIPILEKLFLDAKNIRSNYLMGLSQKTYASIARKYLVKNDVQEILILGSGNLAEDMINQFKKICKVYISARNEIKINELKKLHDLEVIPWKNLEEKSKFSHIVNTIGCEHTMFTHENFFSKWKDTHSKSHYVDLGSPSTISTHLSLNDGVMRLENVFEKGAINEMKKMEQISKAQIKMQDLVKRREELFEEKARKAKLFKEEVNGQLFSV